MNNLTQTSVSALLGVGHAWVNISEGTFEFKHNLEDTGIEMNVLIRKRLEI
jgi:hypothetical protein